MIPVSGRTSAMNIDAVQNTGIVYCGKSSALTNYDIYFYSYDVTSPEISEISTISLTKLKVKFNENIDKTTGENFANYIFESSTMKVLSSVQDDSDDSVFYLTVTPMTLYKTYTLRLKNITDIAGNKVDSTKLYSFTASVGNVEESGFSEPVKLSLSSTDANVTAPFLEFLNNNIFVGWLDNKDGNYELYIKKGSLNNISTWEHTTRLTYNTADTYTTEVLCAGNVLILAFTDNRKGKNQIFIKRSLNYGVTFEPEMDITNDRQVDHETPAMVYSNGKVYLVYSANNANVFDIYMMISDDYAESWKLPKKITTSGSTDSIRPRLSAYGDDIYIVYINANDVYYIKSPDQGLTFSETKNVTTGYFSQIKDIRIINTSGILHLFVLGKKDNLYSIYYYKSSNKGGTWSTPVCVSASLSDVHSFSVTADSSYIYLVYADKRNSNYSLFFKKSYSGDTWTDDIAVSESSSSNSINPFIKEYNGNLYIVYQNDAYGYYDIYLRTTAQLTYTPPEFKIGLFSNPGDYREIIILCKSTKTLLTSPVIKVVEGSSFTYIKADEVRENIFISSHRLSENFSGTATVTFSGADLYGFTNEVTTRFSVVNINSQNLARLETDGFHCYVNSENLKGRVVMLLPYQHEPEIEKIKKLCKPGKILHKEVEFTPHEKLELVSLNKGFKIYPLDIKFKKLVKVYLAGSVGLQKTTSLPILMNLEEKKVCGRFIESKNSGFYIYRGGSYALFYDKLAPRITDVDTQNNKIKARILEYGSGIDEFSLKIIIGNRKFTPSISNKNEIYLNLSKSISEGYHPFVIKVSDIASNFSEYKGILYKSDTFKLASFFSAPNPATSSASLYFLTNQEVTAGKIVIRDISGHLVRRIDIVNPVPDKYEGGYYYYSVLWYLTNRQGYEVSNGVYMAKIEIFNSSNISVSGYTKIAVLR